MRKFLVSLFFISSFVQAGLFDFLSMDNAAPKFARTEGFWSSPADEAVTTFFGRLNEPKSQRENWYAVTPYVAEFWCALSNIGFIYVGIKDKSPEMLFAGLASMASHTVPKQWLLSLDKFAALVALAKVAREYEQFKKQPTLLLSIVGLGIINAHDVYLARQKGQTWGHVLWHLSAACTAHYLLNAIK
ncbi:MAG: hypothetical protein AB7E68_01475 [Candidatus Babeliales bacterium]